VRSNPYGLWVLGLGLCVSTAGAQTPAGTFYIGTYAKKILVMDEATMRLTDSIPVSVGIPVGMQLSYDRKHFYVGEPRSESVEIIDIPTRKSLGTFTLSTPERRVRMQGMNVDPSERFAIMVIKTITKKADRFEIGSPKLVKYDLATRKVTDTIPWPRGEERDFAQILFSPNGENMFFFTNEDVLVYDARTLKQVDRWEMARMFFEEGFGRLPVNLFPQLNEEPGFNTSMFRITDPVNRRTFMGIARTNLTARTVDWTILGPPGPSAPGGMTLAPGRRRAYGLVQQVGNWQYWIFDLENRRIVNRIEFNGRPRMSLTAATDPRFVYLHGPGSTVEIRDANTFQPIRLIEMPADMTSFLLLPPGPGPTRPAGPQ
jgi:hypothetical protein